jgi:putative glutamine amidotransferase
MQPAMAAFSFNPMNRPLIGISSNLRLHLDQTRDQTIIPHAYIQAVLSTGGIPLVIPVIEDPALVQDYFNLVSGLVLIGGEDLDPQHYHQPPHPSLQLAPAAEDHTHLLLARQAVEKSIPFLAICRGHQVLNTVLGGTLTQDIPSSCPGALQHSFPGDPSQENCHPVSINPASRLASLIHRTELDVNSSHHQAVSDIGEGLAPAAWAPDGILEAMELESHPFGISVQWHPERILEQPEMQLIFEGLINASRKKGE